MLVFLKLGGSLITNKAGIQQPRLRLMRRLFGEIRASMDANPDLQILLGHGSGSFGHVPASKFGTLQGVHTPEEWQGFSEVWQAAHALNHIVMKELAIAGLPAMAVSPSSAIVSRNREILQLGNRPHPGCPVRGNPAGCLRRRGLRPNPGRDDPIHRGPLRPPRPPPAPRAHPSRRGGKGGLGGFSAKEAPDSGHHPVFLKKNGSTAGSSQYVDVTGGMRQKVEMMAALVEANPGVTVSIFSGSSARDAAGCLAGSRAGNHHPRG